MSNAKRGRPALLASVTSAEEAFTAFAAGADIIDCKDPSAGALGRLSLSAIIEVVTGVSSLAPVSATIGDTFASLDACIASAEAVAATGVAIVKCGFFGDEGDAATAEALGNVRLGRAKLFAVLMADKVSDFSLVPHLARAGFMGVMLDTADKARGSVTEIMDIGRLEAFVAIARAHHLATGLAGSLRERDIATLVPLSPDLLGFRGALTSGGRSGRIAEERVIAVRRAIDGAAASLTERSVA